MLVIARGDIRAELEQLVEQSAVFAPYENPYSPELGWRGWTNFTLYRKGFKVKANARRCPKTIAALAATPHGPRLGFFARLEPGVHLTRHTGGANLVLTTHLGLIIPDNCGIAVGDHERTWTEGKCLLFDDGFMHEAWNRSETTRYVLVWDVWHPDLTEVERKALKLAFPLLNELAGIPR